MTSVFKALLNAGASFLHPRILALVLWPVVLALILWGTLAWFFWSDWVALLYHAIEQTPVRELVPDTGFSWVIRSVSAILVLAFLAPLTWITALFIASVAAMPVMVSFVAQRNYPHLERKHGGSAAGSLGNALVAIMVFLLLWVLTLPLWLFGPLAAVIPILLAAYLNQRLFRYDALAEHASREEFEQVLERSGGRLYLLGAILGFTQFVPLANLVAPIYIGLAFIHFCLGELERLRLGEPA